MSLSSRFPSAVRKAMGECCRAESVVQSFGVPAKEFESVAEDARLSDGAKVLCPNSTLSGLVYIRARILWALPN